MEHKSDAQQREIANKEVNSGSGAAKSAGYVIIPPKSSSVTPKVEENADEKVYLRQILHEKIQDMKPVDRRGTEVDVCLEIPTPTHPSAPKTNNDSGTSASNQLKQRVERPHLSLPKLDKSNNDVDAISAAATFNSTSYRSLGTIQSSHDVEEGELSATMVKKSDPTVNLSKVEKENGTCSAALSTAASDAIMLSVSGSSCSSEAGQDFAKSNGHINMSMNDLPPEVSARLVEHLRTSLQYNEAGLPLLERERESDIRLASTGQKFARTTESAEYIKYTPEFIIPGANGAAPKPIPLDEVFKTLHSFDNMYLAHEIALSPDFRLERYSPPPESLHHHVQIQMKRAFWDLFNEEIHRNPPVFTRALGVFKEVKQSLLGLLLPHNTKTKDTINRELDVEHISQQINNNAFTYDDFKTHSIFIIETLAHLCSPARDGDIKELKKLDDPAQIFEGILNLAEKMNLDMANFFIQQFRPKIVEECAQYEKMKFLDFLKLKRRMVEDGLSATRNWLVRHTINRKEIGPIMVKAFAELLGINFDETHTPETLALDIGKFRKASQAFLRLAIISAIQASACGHMHRLTSNDVPSEFKDKMMSHMMILLTDEDVVNPSQIQERIEAAAEQTLAIMNDFMKQSPSNQALSEGDASVIRKCIIDMKNPDNQVVGLFYRRTLDRAEQIFGAGYQLRAEIQAGGLTSVHPEEMTLLKDLAHVVLHNRLVYGDLYTAIINNKVGPFSVSDELVEDPEFEKAIQILLEK